MAAAAQSAKAAMARGDYIAAYDAAISAIDDGDESSDIRHQHVLALARMGDTERAMALFEQYGLDRSEDPHQRAAGARLLKDRALAMPIGEARQTALHQAFDAYHAIYLESGDSFPGINAATLALLAGDEAQARALATALINDPAVVADETLFMTLTRAECSLILGKLDELVNALKTERVRTSPDHGACSASYRQLSMIAGFLGLDEEIRRHLLAPLMPPRVIHYSGHMFATDETVEAPLRDKIARILEEENIGVAYGALACGGDLLIAEAVLNRGAELQVVLPLEEEEFLTQSVLPGGAGWATRYHACIERAAGITFASELEFFGDAARYGYAGRMAMGLARLRAAHLMGDAVQIALWDGIASDGPAGTGSDVTAWIQHGGRTRTIVPHGANRQLTRPEPRSATHHERTLAAILFTDFAGFSKLRESALPVFWDGVMREVASVLDEHEGDVACRNSWGDALYAVTTSAPAAAEIALHLQDRLATFDYATMGLDGSGGMRIGAHYGPAYRTVDHITGRTTFYGNEVSKTARIEPITPPGAVFVSESFAAILALEAADRFTCRYVGRIPLAKAYGDLPMYRLTRGSKRG